MIVWRQITAEAPTTPSQEGVYLKYTVNTVIQSLAFASFGERASASVATDSMGDEVALGIYTKSNSIEHTTTTPQAQYSRGLRADRYNAQNFIKRLFTSRGGFDNRLMTIENYNSLPRVVKCHSVRIRPTVDIKKNADHDRAFYSGLAVCGSVWDCPVCSARILEKRRQEIALAINWAYDNGFKVVMVTLTTPHYSYQTCAELLGSFSKALTYLKTGVMWQRYKKSIDWQGCIRGLETLYGANGWHNHTHELWIVDKSLDSQDLKTKVLSRWFKACDRQGLVPAGKKKAFMEHSVDVIDNASASDYLAKHDDKKNLTWGADKELTKPLSKASKELLHPFQLAYMNSKGFKSCGDLFAEYSKAFKGKSAVFWSRGLKKKIGIVEKVDEELAKDETEKIDKLISLEFFAWQEIKNQQARSHILDLAETVGAAGIEAWLRQHKVSSVPEYFKDYERWHYEKNTGN